MPVLGREYTYDAGGYAIDLAEEKVDALQQIQELKRHDWLDLYVRAVSVEFTVYNANVNMFGHVLLLFEMMPMGNVSISPYILTFRAFHSDLSFLALVEIAALGAAISYTIMIIVSFYKAKFKFFLRYIYEITKYF